jgi:hypothetical protein
MTNPVINIHKENHIVPWGSVATVATTSEHNQTPKHRNKADQLADLSSVAAQSTQQSQPNNTNSKQPPSPHQSERIAFTSLVSGSCCNAACLAVWPVQAFGLNNLATFFVVWSTR